MYELLMTAWQVTNTTHTKLLLQTSNKNDVTFYGDYNHPANCPSRPPPDADHSIWNDSDNSDQWVYNVDYFEYDMDSVSFVPNLIVDDGDFLKPKKLKNIVHELPKKEEKQAYETLLNHNIINSLADMIYICLLQEVFLLQEVLLIIFWRY